MRRTADDPVAAQRAGILEHQQRLAVKRRDTVPQPQVHVRELSLVAPHVVFRRSLRQSRETPQP